MLDRNQTSFSLQRVVRGRGIVNSIINKLPVELHIPGYNYCGPGTKLQKRLARGDSGVNQLDNACKEHDISYYNLEKLTDRHNADKILAEKAWQRVKSKEASIGERAAALMVTNMMKAKLKMGLGLKIKKSKACQRKITFGSALSSTRKILRLKKPKTLKGTIKSALLAAKKVFKKGAVSIKTPRVIPIPKSGGVLPFLVPLFAGLSAIGALTGGASGIAKAVNSANNAKKQLTESQRHNQTMEAIAMGRGMHLKPYKNGLGLFLMPTSTKNY